MNDGQGELLAEFRRITTLFISLPSLTTSSADPQQHASGLAELSSLVCIIMSLLLSSRGEVRQLITDDKGTVLIGVFGLSAQSNLGLRAVKCAADICESVRVRAAMIAQQGPLAKTGIMHRQAYRVNIGITTGTVFCGSIGTYDRCEYTFIGDKVNTAARLMVANTMNTIKGMCGIYADEETMKTLQLSSASRINNLFDPTTPMQPSATSSAVIVSNAASASSSSSLIGSDVVSASVGTTHVKYGLVLQRQAALTLKGKKNPFPVWSVNTATAKQISSMNRQTNAATGTVVSSTYLQQLHDERHRSSSGRLLTSGSGSSTPATADQHAGVLRGAAKMHFGLYHRCDIVHKLHTHSHHHQQQHQSDSQQLIPMIVGRSVEKQLIIIRMIAACLNNGLACRRHRRKQAAQMAKQQLYNKHKRRKGGSSGASTVTGDDEESRALRAAAAAAQKLDSTKPVSHGIIFIDSIPGFGKSALLAALIQQCTMPHTYQNPEEPRKTLAMESDEEEEENDAGGQKPGISRQSSAGLPAARPRSFTHDTTCVQSRVLSPVLHLLPPLLPRPLPFFVFFIVLLILFFIFVLSHLLVSLIIL